MSKTSEKSFFRLIETRLSLLWVTGSGFGSNLTEPVGTLGPVQNRLDRFGLVEFCPPSVIWVGSLLAEDLAIFVSKLRACFQSICVRICVSVCFLG
ncbi:hypothetical protein ACOSQ4_004001 [Xanthoceras sorbifolium]